MQKHIYLYLADGLPVFSNAFSGLIYNAISCVIVMRSQRFSQRFSDYVLPSGQSCGSDAFSTRSVSPHPDEVSAEATSAVSECEKEDETEPARQASTIEYLPGMIHSDSPGELLPKFPSWAITSLGKSTVYNASHGR